MEHDDPIFPIPIDSPTEKYSDLFTNSQPPDKTIGEKIALAGGVIIVAAAMGPQVLLGALGTDELVRQSYPLVRYLADGFVGICSGVGKFAIVIYYSQAGYTVLGTIKGWETLGERMQLPVNWLLFTLSVPPALTFPFLNQVGLVDSAKILNDLQLQNVAAVIKSNPSQITFMTPSGLGNLMSFPWIFWGGGYGEIKKAVYYMAENPQYRKIREEMSNDLEAVRNYFKMLVLNEESQHAKNFLDDIIEINSESKVDILETRKLMFKKLLPPTVISSSDVKRESWTMFLSKIGWGSIVAGATIAGVYPFFQIGIDTAISYAAGLASAWGISIPISDTGTKIFASIVTAGMIAMSIPSYHLPGNMLDWLYNRCTPLMTSSKGIIIAAAAGALLAGIIGGAPALYGAFYTSQAPIMDILSVISSNNIELPALYILLLAGIRKVIDYYSTKDDTYNLNKLFEAADAIFREASNLGNLSPLETEELYQEYQNIKNKINSVQSEVIINIESSINTSAYDTADASPKDDYVAIPIDNSDHQLPAQYRPTLEWAWKKASDTYTSIKDCMPGMSFWSQRKEEESLIVEENSLDYSPKIPIKSR